MLECDWHIPIERFVNCLFVWWECDWYGIEGKQGCHVTTYNSHTVKCPQVAVQHYGRNSNNVIINMHPKIAAGLD